MHLRRALPVLRPVVVSTPNPAGGRIVKRGQHQRTQDAAARRRADEGIACALGRDHEATREVNVPWKPSGTWWRRWATASGSRFDVARVEDTSRERCSPAEYTSDRQPPVVLGASAARARRSARPATWPAPKSCKRRGAAVVVDLDDRRERSAGPPAGRRDSRTGAGGARQAPVVLRELAAIRQEILDLDLDPRTRHAARLRSRRCIVERRPLEVTEATVDVCRSPGTGPGRARRPSLPRMRC